MNATTQNKPSIGFWIVSIMIPIVSVFLIWISKKAIAKGWIS